jgi:hypothetical protein
MENHHTLPSPLDEVWLEKMASHFNNQTVSFVLPPKHVFMIRTRAFIQKNGRPPTFEETTTIASDILGSALVEQLLTKGLSVAITENYQTRQKRKLDALQKRGRELVEASGRCLGVSIDDIGCRLHDSTRVLTNGSSSEVYILTHTPQNSPPPLPLAASPSPQPPQPPDKPPLIPPLPPNTPVQIPHPPTVPLGPRSPPKPPVAPGYVFDEFTVTVELALTSEPHVLLDAAVSNAIRRRIAYATGTDSSKVAISFNTVENSVKELLVATGATASASSPSSPPQTNSDGCRVDGSDNVCDVWPSEFDTSLVGNGIYAYLYDDDDAATYRLGGGASVFGVDQFVNDGKCDDGAPSLIGNPSSSYRLYIYPGYAHSLSNQCHTNATFRVALGAR